MRIVLAAAMALGLGAVQPDAARVLADMRQALGGDAALAAIQALSVSGSESSEIDKRVLRALGPDVALAAMRGGAPTGGEPGRFEVNEARMQVEWTLVLPDGFVRVRRVSSLSPGPTANSTDGFRGDALIHRFESDMPEPLNPFQVGTAADLAAREAETVRYQKRESSMLSIAWLGRPAFASFDTSYEGQRTISGRLCDVLQLRSSDGYTATLAVDAATHLPVSVSWVGAPGIVVATSSISMPPSPTYGESSTQQLNAMERQPTGTFATGSTATGPAGQPLAAGAPAGNPAAGLGAIQYQIMFDDFKAVNGMKWPHRITTKTGDNLVQTMRVSKYKLNPKINPKLLDPSRR